MGSGKVRPIAIAIIRKGDKILVFEGYDKVKKETFYRPLGGGIHFGERGEEALRREIREEIGSDLKNIRYIATTENIFVLNGRPGHEIVRIYEGDLTEAALYEKELFAGHEDNGAPFKAIWLEIERFKSKELILHPDGILDCLG